MRLFAGEVTDWGAAEPAPRRAPLAMVWFDYEGTRVRQNDDSTRLLRHGPNGLEETPRDLGLEAQAAQALEGLGAVDLACLDEVTCAIDADYLVRPGAGSSALCAFTTLAKDRLTALGWRVEIDAEYPFQVARPEEVKWLVEVAPDQKLPDWFSLELGVEVGGRRIDLLPLVLDMLDSAADDDDLRSLARRFSGPVALRVSDTHHVEIPVERFRSLVRVVTELYQGVPNKKRRPILFPVLRAAAIAGVEDALLPMGAKWTDPSGLRERARRIVRPAALKAPPPPGLLAELRPYQTAGVAFLQHLREIGVGGVLADDMGLGKTLQTIAHLVTERAAGRLDEPALIVAPTSLCFNWLREIGKFAPSLRVLTLTGPRRHESYGKIKGNDIVITSYAVLVRDADRLAKAKFSSVILDEAQAIKNARSRTHAAIREIRADHHVCLSGTPVENDLGELWAIFDFLQPGLLGDELSFRRSFRVPIETTGDEDRMAALRAIVAPFVLRRLKRDVAPELPPKTELFRPVELADKQRELYEQIRVAAHASVRGAIRKKGLAASTLPILDALMKLRQVCCDPRLVTLDAARNVRESAKAKAFFDLMAAELPLGRRVLVFSQFTSMLALLSHGLKERGIGHVVLTGATRDRQAVVDAFERGEVPVFLISLKAGGTGLNLVSADTVVHYDPWWNPAAQSQATDRAYRIGQTKPVFVHNLYVAGSVEERVLMLQKKKASLSNGLFGDAGVSDSAGLSVLDVEELLAPISEGARSS
ncbi:MAG: DEAD/DEAH box helicase [Polyangiaceae bacterium]|nr:DEAD/DEAH box helicase [Polyangiaceae bacterium]